MYVNVKTRIDYHFDFFGIARIARIGKAGWKVFMVFLRYVGCFLWIFVLAMPFSVVQAQEKFITRVGYYVDNAGSLGVEDVQQVEFIPTQVPLSRGYTATITWLKVEIAPSTVPQLVLSVQPTFLDNVRLYRFTEGVGWSFEQMGDHFAFNDRIRKECVFSFNITPNPHNNSIFFVRLATTSASLIDIQIQTEADAAGFDSDIHALSGIYIGLVLALMLALAWRFVQSRDTLWGIAFVFQSTNLFIAVGHMGFSAKYLLPDTPLWADTWVSIVGVLHIASMMVFLLKLIESYEPHRWILRMFYLLGYILPTFAFMILAIGEVQRVMLTTTLTAFIAPIIITIALYFINTPDKIIRYLLRGIPILLSVYIIYFAAPFFGVGILGRFHIYPRLFTGFLIALLHISILTRRDYLNNKSIQSAIADAKKVQQELELEKASRAAEASFLSMLLHEIKTPMTTMRLAIMSLASGRIMDADKQKTRIQSIQKAIDSMDAVLERTKETDTLDKNKIYIHASSCDVMLLIKELIQSSESRQRINTQLQENCTVNVDGILLNMMLNNLVQNAIMYSSKDSLIDIKLDLVQLNQFKITIYNWVDVGYLPDAKMIFQKYYRSEHARQFTGTGLGLYWVKGVAACLGGDLLYRSEGENRVIFELRLPC
jgi:signal transduction histidine kinase